MVTRACDPRRVDGVAATSFAAMARFLAAESRAAGLAVPAFRSPPRVAGSARTIRRTRDGAVVAIQLRGRAESEVATDMIEGIVVANGLGPSVAEATRARLQAAVAPADIDLTVEPPRRRNLAARARVAERQTQAA